MLLRYSILWSATTLSLMRGLHPVRYHRRVHTILRPRPKERSSSWAVGCQHLKVRRHASASLSRRFRALVARPYQTRVEGIRQQNYRTGAYLLRVVPTSRPHRRSSRFMSQAQTLGRQLRSNPTHSRITQPSYTKVTQLLHGAAEMWAVTRSVTPASS